MNSNKQEQEEEGMRERRKRGMEGGKKGERNEGMREESINGKKER